MIEDMTTCSLTVLLVVLAAIGLMFLIAILVMATVIHCDLKNILRIKDDCYK